MAETLTIPVFCASCQKETAHAAEIDRNSEVVFTCDCGRFIKTPLLEADVLKAHLATHKSHNVGRVPLTKEQLAAQEANQKAIADYWQKLKKTAGAKIAND